VCAMGLLRRGAPNVPQRPGKRLPARPDCQVPAVLATAGSGDPRHHGITAPLPDGITAPLPDSITAPLPDDGPTGAPMWQSWSMPGDPDSPRATGEAHQASHLAPVARPERPVLARLRARFCELEYHVDEAIEHLGPAAHAALGRNHTLPGLRALDGDAAPRATPIRLWPLQAPASRAAADRALPGLLEPLLTAGLVSEDGDEVRAAVDVRPYGSDDGLTGWVVSDLTPGMDGRAPRVADDYVLGVSPASTTLTQLAARDQVDTALDLG